MPQPDQVRLRHMLDAARTAIGAIRGRTRADLDRDSTWAMGLVKWVEIIGEAAIRIGPETHAQHADIPWAQITAMRNRLVHVYFEIDLDALWQTLVEDLPALCEALERILAREPDA